MPRGRPKKQAAEVELLPPDNDQPRPQAQVREIKHKTEWIEAVPVGETPEDDGADFEDVEIEDKPRKKNKNAIQEMRKKLRAQGVTPSSNLRLYIERYVHSETDAGGSWAETEFCTKYGTTEEHILNKDYIDAARKWGPGKYRITIRMDNRIVDAFDERISAPPTSPMIQNVNPADPSSPPFVIQSNGDGQQVASMPSFRDMMKAQKEAFKDHLEMTKLMREAYGFTPEASTQQPRSEEEVLTSAILKQPEVIENVVGSVMKRFGKGGSGDDDPSWSATLMETVKSGQLAPAIDAAFRGLAGLVNMILPRRDNGTPPMAQTPLQNQTQAGQYQSSDLVSGQEVGRMAPASGPSGNVAGFVPASNGSQDTGAGAAYTQTVQTTPEDTALSMLFDHCSRKLPPQVAFTRLINFADAINDQFPAGSIDGYIEMLGAFPTDQVIEYLKTLPGGAELAALPHTKEWTAELQRLIKESQEGEE